MMPNPEDVRGASESVRGREKEEGFLRGARGCFFWASRALVGDGQIDK